MDIVYALMPVAHMMGLSAAQFLLIGWPSVVLTLACVSDWIEGPHPYDGSYMTYSNVYG